MVLFPPLKTTYCALKRTSPKIMRSDVEAWTPPKQAIHPSVNTHFIILGIFVLRKRSRECAKKERGRRVEVKEEKRKEGRGKTYYSR